MTENGGLTATEVERLEASYKIIAQRDGTAERRAFHWQLICAVLLVCTLAVGIWDHIDRRRDVVPFVQVVQVNDDGRVVHVGLPQDLITYQPQDAQWLDMLSEWVRRVRWRGTDPVAAQADWNWARAHLCQGPARTLLDEVEKKEDPFKNLGRVLRAVEVKAATATPVPMTYHVHWEETTTESTQQRTKRWTGTFTVGRFRPTSQAVLMQNRLGLCITAFDLSPQPS
jgi:type IV secretory pathway TrbF-like protein